MSPALITVRTHKPKSGHRTYLDPNPKLVSHRGRRWIEPERKGHRQFVGKQEWR